MSEKPPPPKPKVFTDPNYDRYRRSKQHEDRIGKKVKGRRIPRSGGMRWSEWDDKTANADIKNKDFVIEHKRTENGSMSVKLEWLLKIKEGAAATLRYPALGITFERPGRKPEDWIAIPLDLFERLTRITEDG